MITFNNIAIKIGIGSTWISNTYIKPNTMRFQMLGWDDGHGNIDTTKTKVTLADLESYTTSGAGTWNQVDEDVFDFTKANRAWGNSSSSIFDNLFKYTPEGGSATPLLQHYHFDVIDADLTRVTNIRNLFANQLIHRCKLSNTSSVTYAGSAFKKTTAAVADTLEYVAPLDLSACESIESMFQAYVSDTDLSGTRKLSEVGQLTTSSTLINIKNAFQGCNHLKSLPNITDISGVLFLSTGTTAYYNYENAFYNCASAESGILAMYNKFVAAEKTPMASVFFNCGVNSVTGSAELAQVPGEWGGKLITVPSTIDALTLRMVSSNTHVGDKMPDSVNTTANRKNYGIVYKAIDAYNGIWDVTIGQTTWNNKNYIQDVFTSVIGQGDCSTVTNCSNAFEQKTKLESVCYLTFANSTRATAMFSKCNHLTSVAGFSLPSCQYYGDSNGGMFYNCTDLTSVPLFDTSAAESMRFMFSGCTALTSVPLYNTSAVTNTANMFNGCTAVESGALALYNQASTQTTPPTTYTNMFKNCGSGTTSGAAELAQIPASWGGTGA